MVKVKRRIQSKERSCFSLQRVSRGQHSLVSCLAMTHVHTAKPKMNFSVSFLVEHRVGVEQMAISSSLPSFLSLKV